MYSSKLLPAFTLSVALMAGTASATPTVITFDDHAFLDSKAHILGSSVTEGNFTFADQNAQLSVFGTANASFPGKVALFDDVLNGQTTVTMSMAAGKAFKLDSIDVANLNGPGIVPITFTALRLDGTTAQEAFTFNSFKQLFTLNFNSSFNDVVSVSWQEQSPFHQFTDFTVEPVTQVAEPATLVVFGVALIGLGLMRRRRLLNLA